MNVCKIGAINQLNLKTNQSTAFKAQEKTEDAPIKEGNKRSITAKKWGVGISSFCLPGTGQLVNGQVGKGITMFCSGLVLGALTKLTKRQSPVGIVAVFALLGLNIFSTVDAVKHVKPDQE